MFKHKNSNLHHLRDCDLEHGDLSPPPPLSAPRPESLAPDQAETGLGPCSTGCVKGLVPQGRPSLFKAGRVRTVPLKNCIGNFWCLLTTSKMGDSVPVGRAEERQKFVTEMESFVEKECSEIGEILAQMSWTPDHILKVCCIVV